MTGNMWRLGVPGAVVALAVVLGGCGDRKAGAAAGESGATGSMAAMDTGAAAPSADTVAPTGASGSLTDANILALLDEANQADSASGAMAASKATSAEVKAFGKLMMTDHHKLRAEGAKVARQLQITPAPPADDPVAAMAQQEKSALQSTPKGGQFDIVYIQQTIAGHRAVLDLLDRSASSTTSEEIRTTIEKAKPAVQAHLTKAEAIQKKLAQTS